ncbi:MAG: porphobilinogen synthase [Candidatus Eisenbacteria bacterium]|nr:porphobilinogen synthase [Candidatus Eisenbacteria bacterium]
MSFPITRMRRFRRTPELRAMVREARLSPSQLVLPLFACPGENVEHPVGSMPGCYQQSIDRLLDTAALAVKRGVGSVILFGIPEKKDPVGSAGYAADGIVPQTVRALKAELPQLIVWTDVCMCEYTSHGHCGILKDGYVDNDATLPLLAKASVAYANAGADVIAPSDMMDGRIGAIRAALDEAGHELTPIVSYAAKYASGFYGPFREAAESTPQSGDRRGYQMDPPNADEALSEVALDLEEGADAVMVKPALAYLDIIWRVKNEFRVPVAAYNVSGEYSMIKAAGERGWIDAERVALEVLTAIRRAGADIILTYHAIELAEKL